MRDTHNTALPLAHPGESRGGDKAAAIIDIENVQSWLEWLNDLDMSESAADGGVTSGMVVQQESRWMRAKLSRARAALAAIREGVHQTELDERVSDKKIHHMAQALVNAYPCLPHEERAADDPVIHEVCRDILAAMREGGGDRGMFSVNERVEKISGSAWHGRICGTYSTSLTPEGYCVESEREPGSVQLYPAKALRSVALSPEKSR